MDNAAISEKMISLHNPELVKEMGVCKLWEDLEMTSEKGGELYGMRAMHKIGHGRPEINIPFLPCKVLRGHSYAILTHDQADEIRREAGLTY